MRIAVISETYPPEVNGVALTVQQFVQQMLALGHEVELTRPQQAQHGVDVLEPGLEQHLVRGLRIPRYPDLRFGLPSTRLFRRHWRQRRPDAIYVATEGPLGWSALRAAREMGIRAATGFHTRFDDYVAHYGAGLLTPIVLSWLRRFHNRADITLVPTRELMDALGAQGFRNATHLARAVDTHRFNPRHRDAELRASWGAAEDAPIILHVGRLAPEKNLDLVVRSFELIRARIPAARMVWVGDGPALAQLRRQNPTHIFCGVQRDGALSRHFASGDLFLFPSLTDTFGNVTLEAMASGLPVLAFDYAAAREHIHNGVSGRTVRFGDSEAYIQAAAQLAMDRAQRSEMCLLARAAVASLDQTQVARRLIELLIGADARMAA